MKKLILVALAIAVACATCFASSRTYQIKEKFTGIAASHNIKVTYTEGRNVSVKTTTTAEQLDKVKVSVENNCLIITYDNNTDQKNLQPIRVAITAPMVSTVMLTGAATFKTLGQLSGEAIALTATGDAEISVMGITATTLSILGSGDADVNVDRVMCENMSVALSGQAESSVRAANANELKVAASGQSTFKCPGVNTSKLNVALSGQAEAKLKGKAMVATYDASGQAVIKAADLPANGGSATASGEAVIKCKVAGLKSIATQSGHITNAL